MITQNYTNYKLLQGHMAIMAMADKMCDLGMLGYPDREMLVRSMDLIPRVKSLEWLEPESMNPEDIRLTVGVNQIFDLLEDVAGELSLLNTYSPVKEYNFDTKTTITVFGQLKEITITVTSNGQTVFLDLPFRILEVQIQSLSLYINGEYQAFGVAKDYHIQDSTLIWHSDFDINIDNVVILKYLEL